MPDELLALLPRFAALSDQMHVMANGRIVESGTHDQLMAVQRHYEAGYAGCAAIFFTFSFVAH